MWGQCTKRRVNCSLLLCFNSPHLQYICFFTPCVSQPPIVLVDKVAQLLVMAYYTKSNSVAQRRGFIYFIFERLRGDRRRNCMSFANNSFYGWGSEKIKYIIPDEIGRTSLNFFNSSTNYNYNNLNLYI